MVNAAGEKGPPGRPKVLLISIPFSLPPFIKAPTTCQVQIKMASNTNKATSLPPEAEVLCLEEERSPTCTPNQGDIQKPLKRPSTSPTCQSTREHKWVFFSFFFSFFLSFFFSFFFLGWHEKVPRLGV